MIASRSSVELPRRIYFFVVLATVTPLVTAYQLPPQPAFVNQWLSALLWSVVACLMLARLGLSPQRSMETSARHPARTSLTPADALLCFWLLLLFAMFLSVVSGKSPLFSVLPSAVVVLLVVALTIAIKRLSAPAIERMLHALFVGLLIAALFSATIALLQTVAPNWHDDVWIAARHGDRVFGNLRQPNLLALLCLWGVLAAFALFRSGATRWFPIIASLLLLSMLWASGSRAGWLALPLTIACVLAQRHHNKHAVPGAGASFNPRRAKRVLIGSATLFFLLLGAALIVGSAIPGDDLRAASASQRVMLWKNTATLIAAQPWQGVGFGQLNFAWTLTPLAARSSDVFDHAHNLPLHLAAELGLPIAALLCALLGYALFTAARRSKTRLRASALGVVIAALWQSLFEYPMWFAHFLIPASIAAALLAASAAKCVQNPPVTAQQVIKRRRPWHMFAVATSASAALAIAIWFAHGYLAVAKIYTNASDPVSATRAAQLAQQHLVYGYYGDYASIMLAGDATSVALFRRPVHGIIDEKLLVAWARALEREGRMQEAGYLVARAREFPPNRVFDQLPLAAVPSASMPARAMQDALR